MMKGFIFLAIAGLLFWAAVLMGGYSYDLYRQGAASEDWLAIEADISRFEIVSQRYSRRPVANPHALVSYRYEVSDQNYTGERLSFGPYSKGQLKRPRSGRATIYYDPDNPVEAVYIKGVSRNNIFFMGVVGLVGLIGLIFLILAIKSVRRS